jgi:hypothetical protein
LPGELGVGSQGESVELFGDDETEGGKAVEVIEQGDPAGTLEPLRGVAVSVAEELHTVLVSLVSRLLPEAADEPSGAGPEQGRVVEDELVGPGKSELGRDAIPRIAGELRVNAG